MNETDIILHSPAPAAHAVQAHEHLATVSLYSGGTLLVLSFRPEDGARVERIRDVLGAVQAWCEREIA